jgi:hypothetical protein
MRCGKAEPASVTSVNGQTIINKSEVMGNLTEGKRNEDKE